MIGRASSSSTVDSLTLLSSVCNDVATAAAKPLGPLSAALVPLCDAEEEEEEEEELLSCSAAPAGETTVIEDGSVEDMG